MMRRLFLAGTTVLLCLLLGACANSGSKSGAANVPDDFQIVFGEGGGFSGRWSGHTIDSDGTVMSWEGMSPEENATAAGELSADECSLLWQEIETAHFFESKIQEKGNMTRLVRVTANGKTHEVTWPATALRSESGNPLDDLIAYCREQVATKEQK